MLLWTSVVAMDGACNDLSGVIADMVYTVADTADTAAQKCCEVI